MLASAASAPPQLPENLVNLDLSQRVWNGVALNVAVFQCDGDVLMQLPHQEQARLGVILEEIGGTCDARFQAHQRSRGDYIPRYLHFAPPELEMWGYTNARRVVDATLTFDFDALGERLGMVFDATKAGVPQARFANERIWTLVRMLADVVDNPDPSMQLYGDGLIAAIASQMFAAPQASPAPGGTLAPWQLRRVKDFMAMHFPQRIELDTLAAQVNLSQAHFCRAFKASTGLAPYQWQLAARIERAQTLLATSTASLGDIAQATGFADAVHFGPTFRKLAGMPPGAWRSDRMR